MSDTVIFTRHTTRSGAAVTDWILAFDADCSFCHTVAEQVRESAEGKLIVAGLREPHIRDLRQRALGKQPAWAPTLLAVDGENVRAWTGTALSVRLARLLGLSGSLTVVRMLKDANILQNPARRSLLKAVPGLTLGAFLLSGGLAAPATAKPAPSKAGQWVQANADRLPTTYDEVVSYPMAYRKAIVGALPSQVRSALWTEQIERFKTTHPALSSTQAAALNDATQLASRVFTSDVNKAELDSLYDAVAEAFGTEEAQALLRRLGPDDDLAVSHVASSQQLPDCDVSCDNPSGCSGGRKCSAGPWWCNITEYGCGPFWLQPCYYICL